MAEDKLKQTAEKMGVDIKVETNGASGVANRLTADEIARAKGVIIAAKIGSMKPNATPPIFLNSDEIS